MNPYPYFAYGSNLNLDDLESWCLRNGHPVPRLRPIGTATLPDFELRFGRYSTGRGGGVLDIWPAPGYEVPGALFEVDVAAIGVLDRKEGVPTHYKRVEVLVRLENGSTRKAVTYLGQEDQRRDFERPADAYWQVVERGWAAHRLPGTLLAEAAGKLASTRSKTIPRTSPICDSIFVYGTLLRGELRGHVLQELAPTCWILAEASGSLLDCGDYPGLIESAQQDPVPGELVRLADISVALSKLDEIEGYRGFGQADNLFERKIIEVGTGDGRIRRAWTYMLAGSRGELCTIPGNDWRRARGRREAFLRALAQAHTSSRDLGEIMLRLRCPWLEQEISPRDVGDLARLLSEGKLSERQLAQATGQWVVIPGASPVPSRP